MTDQGSAPSSETPVRQPSVLRVVLPHVVTALVAVLLSSAIAAVWLRPAAAPVAAPAPTAVPQPTPTSPPPATVLPLASGIARQEIEAVRAENDRQWTAIYLFRAIAQIAEAETQLRANDLRSTNQALIAADDSLSQAYDRADEVTKSPIEQLRRDVGAMHDDLYVRPEGMDERLTQLRRNVLALIDQRS